MDRIYEKLKKKCNYHERFKSMKKLDKKSVRQLSNLWEETFLRNFN